MPPFYTPVMTDFPDWQQFPSAVGANLWPVPDATLPPGTYSTGIVPATSFSSLSIVMTASAGAATITVNHWMDAGGTLTAESDMFRVRVGAALVVRTPVRAAFVEVIITVTSPGDMTGTFWTALLASSSDRVSFPVPGQQAGVENTVLAAGATDQWRMPAINSGAATLTFAPGNTLAKLSVEVYTEDENGNVMYHVMFPVSPSGTITQSLMLPGEVTVAQVVNTDASTAHSYGVSLICPPQ